MAGDDRDVAPDAVARREFSHGFRGYSQDEVRRYLSLVARELATAQDQAANLAAQLDDARRAAVDDRPLSREELNERLGGEAARVLSVAEESAAEIRTRAEQNVEKMLRSASAEASQIRAGAEDAAAALLDAAERERGEIESESADRRAAAQHESDEMRAAALEAARTMVAEAKSARRQMLLDLAERRQGARRELTQLRAGIDQLRESYDELRSLLDGSMRVSDDAVDAARRAAIDAAERFDRFDDVDDLAAAKSALTGRRDDSDVELADPGIVGGPVGDATSVDDVQVQTDTPVHTEPAAHEADGAVDDAPPALEADQELVDTEAGTEADADHAVSQESSEAGGHDPEPVIVEDDLAEPQVDIADVSTPDVADGEPTAEDVAFDDASETDADEETDALEPAIESAEVGMDLPPTAPASDHETADVLDDAQSAMDGAESADDELVDGPDVSAAFDDVGADDPETESIGDLPDVLDDGTTSGTSEPESDPPLLGPRDSNIDALFARIRSSREDAVADAEKVLAEPVASESRSNFVAPADLALRRAQFEDLADAHERVATVASALKRALNDQLNAVLDALRQTSTPTTAQDLLGNDVGRVVGAASADALRSTVGSSSADVGSAVAVIDTELGERVVSRLDAALRADEHVDQQVRALFRQLRRERVDTVAHAAAAEAYAISGAA